MRMSRYWRRLPYFWKVYFMVAAYLVAIVLAAKAGELWLNNLIINSKTLEGQVHWLANAYLEKKETDKGFAKTLQNHGLAVYDMYGEDRAVPPSVLGLAVGRVKLNRTFAVIQDQGWLSCAVMMPDKNIVAFGIAAFSLPWATELIIWTIIIIVPTAVATLYFARSIIRPLTNLTAQARSLTGGDLRARITPSNSGYAEITTLERTFNQMAIRLESVLEAERRLLAEISHELRSPLTRMNVLAEILKKQYPETASSYLERVEKEIVLMNALVGELLQQAREHQFQTHVSMFDLTVMLNDLAVEHVLGFRHEDKNIVVRQKDSVLFLGDRVWLQKAFGNVIQNALSFTAPSTTIDIDIALQETAIFVTVRDYGPGVPNSMLHEIFRPFCYNVDGSSYNGNTGLGLDIARRAVMLHHGTITAQNMHPGLAITITLPNNVGDDMLFDMEET